MLAKVFSASLVGLEGNLIEVEVDITVTQLGNFIIVGLPDVAVQESRERIRSAIKNAGFTFPTKRVAVNLAPADIKKQGPSFDLPIALAIVLASDKELESAIDLDKTIFIGELALDGMVRAVTGIVPIVLAAKEQGMSTVVVPYDQVHEARVVEGVEVVPVKHLAACIEYVTEGKIEEVVQTRSRPVTQAKPGVDMKYIQGQEHVKRAIEIAAAGGHNVLMTGPPGSGKTMIAQAITTILPELTTQEALEVSCVYSVIGHSYADRAISRVPPFRNPHHTASGVSLIGGGTWPRPGEVSLAHHGVLFLDELPEFPRVVLEQLRQPLEEGQVVVSRIAGSYTFPAQCMLVAAMNPCPCGFVTDQTQSCACSAGRVQSYQQKISGPLLDRIDIHVEVPRVTYELLTAEAIAEDSATIRSRVVQARDRQLIRSQVCNSQLTQQVIKKVCAHDAQGAKLLEQAVSTWGMSARSYYRVLKVARTIADCAGVPDIQTEHIAEALQYRSRLNQG